MGITPISQRQKINQPYVGHAQTAYFGGRTSAHIRKVPVPVVYVDFLSMYPTVNSLMNLWRFVIAKNIRFVPNCRIEVINSLETISVDRLFIPDIWKQLTSFVLVVPDGDILPTRGQYSLVSNDWQVAVNYLHANAPDDALWFSLPDVVASVILTGKVPKIIDSFRVEPSDEPLPNLVATQLRGTIPIDPTRQDFFKAVIEERKRVDASDLDRSEKARLSRALKVLANSASYGIYGQMDRRESSNKVLVECHGIDPQPYTCRVENPEKPGEYCYPPVASLITGAARLMLALLERCIADLGGTYAMEDTDSMAIVATKHGGLFPRPGGPHRTGDSLSAVKAISWKDVAAIAKRFESLNPYDRAAVSGSILKIEGLNFDPENKRQRQIWCLAISAKRYALFLKENTGKPSLLRKGRNCEDDHWSEHGLGHLLNPTDLESEDRDWIAQIWHGMICSALAHPAPKLDFENKPAIGRLTITSPKILEAFRGLRRKKTYQEQIKPFNFLLTCHIDSFGHPLGMDPEKFHLIALFETDSRKWTRIDWIDQYSGETFKISTQKGYASKFTARVKTYGDIVAEYEHHPESKCADEYGGVCSKETIGLLFRRRVRIGEIQPIGKESNHLEDVDAGLIHSANGAYTSYPDVSRDKWERVVRPRLKALPLPALIAKTGLSRRMLINSRQGHARPHLRNQRLITHAISCLLPHDSQLPIP